MIRKTILRVRVALQQRRVNRLRAMAISSRDLRYWGAMGHAELKLVRLQNELHPLPFY